MTESKRHRAGSWWDRPGAPISLVLCTTVAATIVLTVITVILVIWPFDPQPPCLPKCNNGESSQAVVVESEDLKAIARAVTAPQNLSITVKLDEKQLRDVVTAAREATLRLDKFGDSVTEIESGTRDIASNAKRIADRADGIAGDVHRVAGGVIGIAGKMDGIAGGVNRVAAGVVGIAGDTKSIAGGMKRVGDSADNIAGDTRDIAGDVHRITDSVIGIAGKMDNVVGGVVHIVSDTKGIAIGVRRIANKMGKEGISENLMGTVHFPHDSPQEFEEAECKSKLEESKNITKSMKEEMEEIVTNLEKKIKETDDPERQQCVLVVGHANTLGTEPYNEELSGRRAELVTSCLKNEMKFKIDFGPEGSGDRKNKDNLHHPDYQYRTVDVYLCSEHDMPCFSRCRAPSRSSEP